MDWYLLSIMCYEELMFSILFVLFDNLSDIHYFVLHRLRINYLYERVYELLNNLYLNLINQLYFVLLLSRQFSV